MHSNAFESKLTNDIIDCAYISLIAINFQMKYISDNIYDGSSLNYDDARTEIWMNFLNSYFFLIQIFNDNKMFIVSMVCL